MYRWQCCGRKALFLTEKNAKLHVAVHVKAAGGQRLQGGRPSSGVTPLAAAASAAASAGHCQWHSGWHWHWQATAASQSLARGWPSRLGL